MHDDCNTPPSTDMDISTNSDQSNKNTLNRAWPDLLLNRLRQRGLSKVAGETIYIATDYSGTDRTSQFFVVSATFLNYQQLAEWDHLRTKVRSTFLQNGRRISFKDMNDGQRRRSLQPFLQASRLLPGTNITVAFDKSLKGFGGLSGLKEKLEQQGRLEAKWKSISFDRAVLVSHLLAVLISAQCVPGQNIIWISDRDEIFSSDAHSRDSAYLSSLFLSTYVNHHLGKLNVGTTSLDEGDRLEEDLCAIADLAAGAIGEIFTGFKRRFGRMAAIPLVVDFHVSEKTELIWEWLFEPAGDLKKLIAWVGPTSEAGMLQVAVLTDEGFR